jgi:tetratricopeptide (TPR) repeat protein
MTVTMDAIRFFFWEALKAVTLAFVALICVKTIGGLRLSLSRRAQSGASVPGPEGRERLLSPGIAPIWMRRGLYILVLALVVLGARAIGNDVAAEIYFMASRDNLQHLQPQRAYTNALRAATLRSGQLRYWQMLSTSKLALHQYQSVLDDQPALESLEGGHLGEQDTMRLAFADFFLGRYDQAITVSLQLIQKNPLYAAPYLLLGMTYTARTRYTEAEQTYLHVLQMYPSEEPAVEGLAHLYFLMGNPARAVAVLDQTAIFPFDADARKRFEQLKALYTVKPVQNGTAQDDQDNNGDEYRSSGADQSASPEPCPARTR